MGYTRRLLSPKYYKVSRKSHKFIVTTIPGPYGKDKSIPIAVALRDILKIADNIHEVRHILSKKAVKIDNKIQTNFKFPIGFMDVLTINNENYRVLVNEKGLYIKPIDSNQAKLKLLKIVRKCYVKNNKLQLSFHDGRTLLVEKDMYKTGDVVLFDLETKQIKQQTQFKRGAMILITEGRNKGKLGVIEDMVIIRGSQPNKIIVKTGTEKIETLKDYTFVLGQDTSLINM
ncbi:MAG: 30S ribosomal protein S4e [Candidatus Aenigmarchaeota archaeon]|nr:30S ribosomal protein S4e [Candidatus Aenigmarchaeota archaeon]